MNPTRLVDFFDRISEAPDAVPRLRRFILDLAVRGKLVEHDPIEESGAVLLKHIQEQKVRLMKEGVLRQGKPLPAIAAKDIPFTIPTNWVWARIGETSRLITKGSTPTSYGHSYQSSGVNFIKVEAIRNGQLLPQNVTSFISEETNIFLARSRLAAGDILFSIAGSIGTCARVSENVLPANTNQALAIIRGTETIFNPEFVLFCIKSSVSALVLSKARGGAMNNISLEDIRNFLVPIPPLKEQHRIVAKVNELSAVCDRLEARQRERESRRDRLAAASHHHLNNDANSEAFRKHAHFYLGQLPRLTTRPDLIRQLRQTILNLAVRGKLVEQDPSDEPAYQLLKRIQDEKARLISEGKIKQQPGDIKPGISASQIPQSWQIVTISDVAYLRSGIAVEHGEEMTVGDIPYVKVADLNLADNRDGIVTSSRFVGRKYSHSVIEGGSIVFPKRGGAIATNRKRLSVVEIVCDSNLMAMRPFLNQTTPYLQLWFSGFDLWKLNSGTSVPQINNKDIHPLTIPLPPLAEQLRIVAKVNELRAVCDRLETQLTTAQAEASRLLEAVLRQSLAEAA
jgi:type I restriction enzyme S subunit